MYSYYWNCNLILSL